MIEEPRVLEYSGREYAIVKWGGWIKLFLLSAIFMNVFVIPGGLGTGADLLSGLLGILAVLGKLVICGTAIVVIDASFAKLRFFRIAEFLGGAFLLALIGIITSYVVAK
jgi:formate hydrogenlyase subunit 4